MDRYPILGDCQEFGAEKERKSGRHFYLREQKLTKCGRY